MSIKCVAVLFCIGGILETLGSIAAIFLMDAFTLSITGLINILAGFRLWHHSRGWRIYSLIYLWLSLAILGCTLIWNPKAQTSPSVPWTAMGNWWWCILALFVLYGIACVILMLPAVKKLCAPPSAEKKTVPMTE